MLKTVITILLALLLIPDIYLYRRFVKPSKAGRWAKLLWWLPLMIIIVGTVLTFIPGRPRTEFDNVFIIFFLCTLSGKFIFMLFSLIDRLLKSTTRYRRNIFTISGAVIAVIASATVIYSYGWGVSRFTVTEVTVASPDLPEAFDGYRIARFSDLHIGSWRDRGQVEKIVDLINAQKADMVVFTGDIVNSMASELDGYESTLEAIAGSDGTFSVLGNHDYCGYQRHATKEQQAEDARKIRTFQHNIGWHLLNNESTIIRRGPDSIALIGVENWGEPPFPQHGDLEKAMRGTDSIGFKILLSHNPMHWRHEIKDNAKADIDLTLSGHTHAMQLRIGDHSPAVMRYPEWGGLYGNDGKSLYVNQGVGYIVPFRFGAWPEITVITLKREP